METERPDTEEPLVEKCTTEVMTATTLWIFVTLTAAVLGSATGYSVDTTRDRFDEIGLALLTAAGLLAIYEIATPLSWLERRLRSSNVWVPVIAVAVPALGCAVGAVYVLSDTKHFKSASIAALVLAGAFIGISLVAMARWLAGMLLGLSRLRAFAAEREHRRHVSLLTAGALLIAGSCLQWLAPFLGTG
jgi:lysylphosphatidylglycerol synthetase-like protein (DUF2156 family)